MLNYRSYRFRVIIVMLALSLVVSSGIAQAFSFSMTTTTTSRNPSNAYIPAGTIIPCELITPLNSGRNYQGERVMFKTTGALVVNGVTIVPNGAAGEAIISEVRKAGGFGRGGKITITTRSIKAVNGADIPVRFEMDKSGGGQGGWVIPAFVVISILAGFIQGSNQDLPAGTRFSVAVEADYDLGVESEQLAEVYVDPNKPKVASNSNVLAKSNSSVPDIMTVEQAATYLQVSPEVVNNLIQENKIKAVKVGEVYRIKKVDIDNM